MYTFSSIEKDEYHRIYDFLNNKQVNVKSTGKMDLSADHFAETVKADADSDSDSCLLMTRTSTLQSDGSGCQGGVCMGGAAKLGCISITYHKYILGVHKYILRLEISTFDHENH